VADLDRLRAQIQALEEENAPVAKTARKRRHS
jgi:hypothetical protein